MEQEFKVPAFEIGSKTSRIQQELQEKQMEGLLNIQRSSPTETKIS